MSALGEFIEEHAEVILEPFLQLVYREVQRYAQYAPTTFPANARRMLRLMAVAIDQPDDERLQDYVEELCEQRLPMGFQLVDVLQAMFLYNDVMIPLIFEHVTDDARRLQLVIELENSVESIALRFTRVYFDQQMRQLDAQRQAVLELSTPVIKVWDGIVALPLIGTIDSYRSRQVMEELLTAIVAYQADIVIVDITGVPVVDTNVADHLIKTIRAAELLGAQCLLVGLGSDLAQTVVGLGVDLRGIESAADMRQGLTLAFKRLGYSVVRDGGHSGTAGGAPGA